MTVIGRLNLQAEHDSGRQAKLAVGFDSGR
jgi:hypothetical protein